jgi:HEAT repeats
MPAPRLALIAVLLAAPLGAARASDAQVERALRALREDGSLKVRAQAAFVLAQRGARAAVPALCKALSEDEAPAVRVAAATALGRIGGQGGAAVLREAGAHDPDDAVRSAAARALDELQRGARSVSLEEVQGGKGDARARASLHDALAMHLQRRGFAVVEGGEGVGYRLKPSMLVLDVVHSSAGLRVEVKASVIAIDGQGRIAAMVEGGARAKTATPGAASTQLAGQAVDAAARSISEDLAHRLLEAP